MCMSVCIRFNKDWDFVGEYKINICFIIYVGWFNVIG